MQKLRIISTYTIKIQLAGLKRQTASPVRLHSLVSLQLSSTEENARLSDKHPPRDSQPVPRAPPSANRNRGGTIKGLTMGYTARIAYTVRIREEQTVQLRHEKKRLALTNEGSVRTPVYQRIDTCRTAFAGFTR